MKSKHQVLIVDDEPLNVKLFASILSVDGYKEKQFAIVLGDADRKGAGIVAERLRSLVENHFSRSSGNNPAENSAVIVGIAEYPADADSMEQLINQAVDALFDSKRKYYAEFLKN